MSVNSVYDFSELHLSYFSKVDLEDIRNKSFSKQYEAESLRGVFRTKPYI